MVKLNLFYANILLIIVVILVSGLLLFFSQDVIVDFKISSLLVFIYHYEFHFYQKKNRNYHSEFREWDPKKEFEREKVDLEDK